MIGPAKGQVLITGSARRIGRVLAMELARAGWDIVIHYHQSQTEAQQLAADIRTWGQHAYCCACDLANADAVASFIPHVIEVAGPLTALVNNAALFERDESDPDGQRHMQINAISPHLLVEQFRAQLPEDGGGSIINILDAGPFTPAFSAYGKSKQALEALTFEIARNYAPRIRSNGIALGPTLINTRESPEHFAQMISACPLKRGATPEDVAFTTRFLLENTALTGQILYVDGGAHLLQ